MSPVEMVFSAIADFIISLLPASWQRKMPAVQFFGVIVLFLLILGLIIWVNW